MDNQTTESTKNAGRMSSRRQQQIYREIPHSAQDDKSVVGSAALPWTRRRFLASSGAGFGSLALSHLLQQDGFLAAAPAEPNRRSRNPLAPRDSHHEPRAKSIIFIFAYGGPSQVDLFDPKPDLAKWAGKPVPGVREDDIANGGSAVAMPSPYQFKQYGQAGIDISEKFPQLARRADDLCVIRSMHCKSNVHGPAIYQMNTGFVSPGYPSMGSWVTYGLGSETDSLPAFVVMWDHRGGPIGGAQNWGTGFLPAAYQGTPLRSEGNPILDLEPPPDITGPRQVARLKFLAELNEKHLDANPGESELSARIASYELAYRMQMEAPDAVSLKGESLATKKLYGIDDPSTEFFGRQCLLARRMVEKGVRFVQLYSGGGVQQKSWDAHFGLKDNHDLHCAESDRPLYGLLTDLKARGMLDSTLVVWGGEFGRLPTSEEGIGRDHNSRGFTMWLAGGGVRAGHLYGATDEFGFAAVENPVSVPDLHATCLHQIGLNHRKLTYRHSSRDMRLTDTSGKIVTGILSQ